MLPLREGSLQSDNTNYGILTGMDIRQYVFNLKKKVATSLFSGKKRLHL